MLGLGLSITKGSPSGLESAAPDDLFLDTYSGAVVAFSLRKLSNDYTGDAIRIRRDGDNAETDIGFSGGELDTSAISSHCGSNDGFVVTWYDQASGYDATQSTSSKQPKIYDGTSGVITESTSGKPAMEFDKTSSQELVNTSSSMASDLNGQDQTWIEYVSGESLASFADITATNRFLGLGSNATSGIRAFQYNTTFQPSTITFATPRIEMGFLDLTTKKSIVRANGTDGTESTATDNTITVGNNFTIGSLGDQTPSFTSGEVLELIVYNSYKFSDRVAIETSINDFYSAF